MAFQNLVGAGIWLPNIPYGYNTSGILSASDTPLLDADEEEFQSIGRVRIDGGGSKTFGTSGSTICWLPGASITFAANSTLTVGAKKTSVIDTANGPPARATIGAASFSVYKALVGGTDTISSTTWREDAMASGTPFTVADGDLIAVCWHLDTTSGSPSVKIRGSGITLAPGLPTGTLVTSGPTYTAQGWTANYILKFDDGTLGWIEPTIPFSVLDTNSANLGNGNIFGNIFRVPFPCKVDTLAAAFTSASSADFALELYQTPLGTPSLIESVAFDINITTAIGARLFVAPLTTPRTLSANTDYLVGIKQTTATNFNITMRDQFNASYAKALGMGADCYAANSTAGATFASQNSGKRRYLVYVRISALDDGVSSGGSGPSTFGVRARRP